MPSGNILGVYRGAPHCRRATRGPWKQMRWRLVRGAQDCCGYFHVTERAASARAARRALNGLVKRGTISTLGLLPSSWRLQVEMLPREGGGTRGSPRLSPVQGTFATRRLPAHHLAPWSGGGDGEHRPAPCFCFPTLCSAWLFGAGCDGTGLWGAWRSHPFGCSEEPGSGGALTEVAPPGPYLGTRGVFSCLRAFWG